MVYRGSESGCLELCIIRNFFCNIFLLVDYYGMKPGGGGGGVPVDRELLLFFLFFFWKFGEALQQTYILGERRNW